MNTLPDFSRIRPSDVVNEIERLRLEVARLQEERDDLRASAFLWRNLYERALPRATERDTTTEEDHGRADRAHDFQARAAAKRNQRAPGISISTPVVWEPSLQGRPRVQDDHLGHADSSKRHVMTGVTSLTKCWSADGMP